MNANPLQHGSPLNLEPHKWRNRVLLLFAPSPEDERLTTQQAQFLNYAMGMADRALIRYNIFADEITSDPADAAIADGESARQTRQRYDVALEEFVLVLIGKDGTEKRRYQEPVDVTTIFDIIDAMPMRQQEMRRQ